MKVKKKSLLQVILALSMAGLGCDSRKDEPSDPSAITNRLTMREYFVATVKLKQPALLVAAERKDGKLVVSEAARDALLKEHEEFKRELRTLSDEIEVIFEYKNVINGMALKVPKRYRQKFFEMAGSSSMLVEEGQRFDRPSSVTEEDEVIENEPIGENTSVKFIRALEANEKLGAKGQGIRVGVVDTGIDFTHAMFGGPGTVDIYKSTDPSQEASQNLFPNNKVVGGYDFAGTEYDSGAASFDKVMPKPDKNPIDESGHGSHVAGTIAGIGDGQFSYSGVAPDAQLYALKVFGKDGSTDDFVVLAALDYSADPNGDYDLSDRLDVVNLSLGSGFGTPHILYNEAIKNLTDGGIFAAISAGNSGDIPYIVGAPSVSDTALSVAASVDNMEHNYKFKAVTFTLSDNSEAEVEAIEGSIGTPLKKTALKGELAYVGLAKELTDEQKSALNGKVALVDRGEISFCDKFKSVVAAGATGMVAANNQDGQPIAMGGDCQLKAPAIMVTKALGDRLKQSVAKGPTQVDSTLGKFIEKPELIDTITSFSSRGPRSVDGWLKPEISAPGYNVVSAAYGKGDKYVKMSGTSMAGPHIAGVAALIRQYHPTYTVDEMKAVMMGTAVVIDDEKGVVYPVARQGAGRVDVVKALESKVAFSPAALSLGRVVVERSKQIQKSITVKNLTDSPANYELRVMATPAMKVTLGRTSLTLGAKESVNVPVTVTFSPEMGKDPALELSASISVMEGDKEMAHAPVFALLTRAARITARDFVINATSKADSEGATAAVTLSNDGETAGDALLFNLIAEDERKAFIRQNQARSDVCDLQAAGYRILDKEIEGTMMKVVQFAVKLYNPVTSWNICEVSIQIDGDQDGVADQELLGTSMSSLKAGSPGPEVALFGSLLTDANVMRSIARDFETGKIKSDEKDFTKAVVAQAPFGGYGNSTVAVVTVAFDKLKLQPTGDLKVKIATLSDTQTPEADDFLGSLDKWFILGTEPGTMAYVNLPDTISLAPRAAQNVSFVKGAREGKLMLYVPQNMSTLSDVMKDQQYKVVKPKYQFGG
jgi:subtilisin family serine protease